MAEGLLRHYGGGRFEVCSAGTAPQSLNPLAVQAMAELGIDISGHYSKDVSVYQGEQFDYVVTVCDRARDNCPVLPGEHNQLHWGFRDPAAATGSESERLQQFREVRDEIGAKIRQFVGQHGE